MKNKAVWSGYSIDDIEYERALTLARIQVEKERMGYAVGRVREGNVMLSGSVFSRLLGALNYADYFVLLMQLYKKLSPLFRHKKQN